MMILKYSIPATQAGMTVYTVLRRQLGLSATLTRRLKQAHAIFCDGQPVFTTQPLEAGQTVWVDVDAAEPPCDIVPEPGPVEILWETEFLLAVNKPAGVLTHPSRAKYTGTLANHVAQYLADTRARSACHAVNRLDRDTSGVVLFGKNAYAKEMGIRALSTGRKEYIAIVFGTFDAPEGVIDLPIRRQAEGNMRRIVAPDGQRAITHYETCYVGALCGQPVSFLRLRLETGRTHQIRVHMAACGHPLLGDRLYGCAASVALSESLGFNAHLLHADTLAFQDPATGQPVCIHAPVHRTDMQAILTELKIYS
jgi:23S rRNA pseudouridine1911/1915/1917 synthase